LEVIRGNRLKTGDYKYIGGFPHFVADGGEDFAAAGGLISYGPGLSGAYRQAGVYAGKILNRANRPTCR